jgi:cytochrome c peroxidase
MRFLKLFVIALFVLPALAIADRFLPLSAATSPAVTLTAPTTVSASDGDYYDKVGLTWDTIRDATIYRVFRNTVNNSGTATDVGTTVANFFFDSSATAGTNYFYWVRAENGSSVSPMSVAENGLRGVGTPGPGWPPLNPPPVPAENPITAAKTFLGKTLFWEEQMSSTRTVACGTCHFANHGGSDSRSIIGSARATNPGPDLIAGTADDIVASPGVPSNNIGGSFVWDNTYGYREQVTGRKSRSYVDAGYGFALFWDGRALNAFTDPISNTVTIPSGAALESQVLGPPISSAEMGHQGRDWTQVAARIASVKPLALSPSVPAGLQTWIGGRSYPELFNEVYGTPDVTPSRIAMAIATFERTLYSDRTPADAAEVNIAPLTAEEQRGDLVFRSANCNFCHGGPQFTDDEFHFIGVRPASEDPGRFNVTMNQTNMGEFRTPSLRNVALRAPYMHNGRFATLEDVINFYDRGGDFDAPNKDHDLIRPLGLNAQQKSDLAAYLRRPLTDPRVAAESNQFARPTLYSESSRVPVVTGTGVAGAGGNMPLVQAIEPPLAGNPQFTVGVSKVLGGAQAVLVVDSNDPGTGPTIPATGSFARVTITLGGTGAGGGWGSAVMTVPATPAIIGQTFFGRWYVTDAGAAGGVAVSPAFRFTVFGEATTAIHAAHADFDGDGKTDISVFRPSAGSWYIQQSNNSQLSSSQFGQNGDQLAPGDYDQDGKADLGVFRDGNWYLQESHDGFHGINFGTAGDRPVPADYDGDGKDDLAVFRPSTGAWYILQSRDGFRATIFGQNGDLATSGDFDGDGKADLGIFRAGTWYLLQSTGGFRAIQFGSAGDRPVVADFDGDHKDDIAVFRPSNGAWYYLRSVDGQFVAIAFGQNGDQPSPGDYDGDGRADQAVFRPSNGYWYLLQSTGSLFRAVPWGLAEDQSVPAYNVP